MINKTNVSVQKTNFLDMTISIYRGKLYITLYDKRNDYNFSDKRMCNRTLLISFILLYSRRFAYSL